jgi:hypothetical protein
VTLDEVKAIQREYLTPAEIASVFGVHPQDVRKRVWDDRRKHINTLGFPTVVFGRRIKVPKAAFIKFMEGGQA